jgi:hypothetical protein
MAKLPCTVAALPPTQAPANGPAALFQVNGDRTDLSCVLLPPTTFLCMLDASHQP